MEMLSGRRLPAQRIASFNFFGTTLFYRMDAFPHVFVLICAMVWLLRGLLGWIWGLFTSFRHLGDCPGRFALFIHPFGAPATILGSILPRSHRLGNFYAGISPYLEYGSTCLSSVVLWSAKPVIWIADADAIRTICTERTLFAKDPTGYDALNIFGRNVISTEGSEWKRHRSVARSAFNEANNALVWEQSSQIISQWFSEIETTLARTQKTVVEIDIVTDISKVTLLVVCSASFGKDMSWADDQMDEHPGQKSFQYTVINAIHFLMPRLSMPDWLPEWTAYIYIPFVTPYVQRIRVLFEDLRLHILDLISIARDWVSGASDAPMSAALLRNLVEANDENNGVWRLSNDEVLADVFMFLLAGYETSAHALSFTFVLLALYSDIQRKVYKEVKALCAEGAGNLTYKDHLPHLIYTSAVFHEALRHFPVVPRLGRVALTDTVLKARRFTSPGGNSEFSVPIKKGSYLLIDLFAVHMNPIHWGHDVHEFKPERFIDTETYRWPRNAFLAFSAGYRSCIGERFALTEVLCVLAHVIRRYEVLVPSDLRTKPFEEQKERLLSWRPVGTALPTNARVVFRRRT